ncbi:MAG: hypothetical protein ACWA41_04420 [Putridiphycobacter sp.]
MKNFNISLNNDIIGSGIKRGNHIFVLRLNDFVNLNGLYNVNGFLLKNDSIEYIVRDVNEQFFNIFDKKDNFIGIARFS